MPKGDGTGPQGRGPMTGRGMGSCGEGRQSDNLVDQNQNFGGRLLSGIGRMFGYGQRKGGGNTGKGRRGGQRGNR
ncbi:DUF5320 domain-containing protein [candidate division KSB1 bacterium]|nr:DUF5320 domain-containing protein [candidate division KSB1 bacterium]